MGTNHIEWLFWDNFDLSGDLDVRQLVDYDDGSGMALSGEERYRHRMQYRLALRLMYTPEGQPYFAFVNLGTHYDYTESEVTYDSSYGAVYVREAFVQHNGLFDLFDLAIGLFNVENETTGFARTNLSFDSDVSLGGLHWMFHLADDMVLHGIQSVVQENANAPDLWIFAAQLEALGLLEDGVMDAALGLWIGDHWNTVTVYNDAFIVLEALIRIKMTMFMFVAHALYNVGINSDAPDDVQDNNFGGLLGAVMYLDALRLELFHYYLGGRAWFPGLADLEAGLRQISGSVTAIQGFEFNWFYTIWKGLEIGMQMNLFWEVGDGQPGVSDQDIMGAFTFEVRWMFDSETPE